MLVSVVCPFYNESAFIVSAARKMIAALEKQVPEWELILVNDGSQDDSLNKLLDSLKENDHKVSVLSCEQNQGRGRALMNGIQASKGDIIVTTEADGSWGEDIVQRLVSELTTHPEIHFVIASPNLPGGGLENVPWRRRVLTGIGNKLIGMFFDSNISMNTGMTRAYRREVIQPLEVWENGKEFHLEVLLKLINLGFSAREIPAKITWPIAKSNKKEAPKRASSTKIFKTIGTHLRFIAIARPTVYFAVLAIISLVVSCLFMLVAVINLMQGGPAVFYAIIGVLMFVISLVFVSFSVLFVKLGEVIREDWAKSYRDQGYPIPPSIHPAQRVPSGNSS